MSKSKFSNQKLYPLILSLTGVEKRELHHFLASTFFNRRGEVERLWQFLLQHLNDEGEHLSKEQIHEHLFPGEAYDDGRMRYTLSFLQQRIEWFLAYRHWDGQAAVPGLSLAEAYRERDLEAHFRHTAKIVEGQLGQMPHGLERRHAAFRLEQEKHAFSESQKRSRESALQAVHDAFDVYALSGKLRLACLMAAHQAVVKVGYQFSFLSVIAKYLEESHLLAEPEIGMYYHCYLALTENNEAHFRAFRTVLERHGERFDPAELKDILLLAANFCIRRVNAGAQHFVQEAFELYRWGLERGMLTERGVLSRFTYKNIVALGLGLREFSWVEGFLHEWKPALEERYRESSFCYNSAKLLFAQKDFRSAMPLLARVDDTDFLLMLDAKVLLLKMYYESGEWEPLESLIASFYTFLRRKTNIGYHREHYRSLLRYTQKLLSLQWNDKTAREDLRRQIAEDPAVLEKDWLLASLLMGGDTASLRQMDKARHSKVKPLD